MDGKAIIRDHFDVYAPSWHDRLQMHPYNARREAVIRMLKGVRPAVVVDIGCGTGDYAPLFDPAITKYIGIDISEKMIEQCHRLYPKYSFTVGDADRTGLPCECADLVLSIAVLEYYTDPEAHMLELTRVCKSGGLIIIAAPNGEDMSKRREKKIANGLRPVIKLKHKIYRKKNGTLGSRKISDVLHERHTEREMDVLGKRFGIRLTETRFVNFQFIPRIFDQYLHWNARWSRWVISKGCERTFRKSATILVCKFRKDDVGLQC